MNHEIRIYGDPVLRTKADPIREVNDAIRALGQEMIGIMRASEGVGLAAQQIGETIAICVIEVPVEYDTGDDGERLNPDLPMPLVLINPVITQPTSREESREEGCLSFPDIRGNIIRPVGIHLNALDDQGRVIDCDVSGFTARVIQHEVDHLNGVLFIDRMSAARRFTLASRLRRMQASQAG